MLRTSHGRPAALTSLVLPALIQLCLILCEPANGQSVQCYSAVGCSVTDIIALGLPAEDCCVPGVNRINNGLYYQLVESPGCTPCMVYGFDIPGESMESPSFTAEESDSERYFLPIRRLKGMVDLVEELIVEVVPGTAVEGEDFVIETKNIRFSGETTSVVVTFREDGVALEEDETFVLRLSGSRQAFFVNTLAVTISDPEGIEISFTKHDYRGSERLQEVLVVLEANRRPATPVTMSVTSLIYSELGSQYDVEFVPDREQASEQDFSPEVQFVTFLPDGPANPSVTVRITNDEINEGEEVFAVIVELVEALDPSRVTIGLRNASLCRIMDDDQIFIGFEFDSYYYTETEDIVNNPTRTDMVAIYLVKSVESEQSFSVNVATRVRGTGGNGRNAIHNVDYSIGENDEQVLEFGPDQERVLITLYLFDDSLPELTEAAQLVISQDETSVGNFTLSDNATTTIFIMDDGDPVIAELSPDFAVVIESVGAIEFCLNVTVPGPQEPLPFDVAVLLETSSVSADEDDYEEVSIFNSPQLVQLGDNSHRMCFNVTINDDDLVEVTETFLLTATTVGEVPFQALPNVSVVSILDNDAARVEITPESITVPEDIGSVEICASVVSGQFDPSLDATVSYRVYTQRDTAGSEDFEAFLLVNSTAVDQLYTSRLCFFVSIIDDDLVESFESFRVIAELSVDPTLAVILSPNVSHITITDNDEVTIGFIPESSLVLEMNGTITVSVGVIAGQIDHGVTVEVRLFTEDLTATAQQDYSPVDCQLFFNSTTVVLHVRVGILTDSIFEDEEQFQVQIESRQDFVNLLPAESVVTIADNSPDALIGLEETHFLVREGDDIVDVCVRIVGTTLDRSVTITLVTSDETATSPGDYQQTVALLTFNSTVNRLCTTIEVVDDNVFESDEVFYVIIGDTNSSITISPESGVVTIEDNDELTYGFVSDEYTVSEAVGSFQLCVVLYTNISIETVLPPFTLRFHDITSKGGSDYVEVNTSFILVETESWCTDIEIIDDHVSETDETFEVLLLVVETTDEFEGLRSRIVLQPHNARVTIRDNDGILVGFTETEQIREEGRGFVDLCVEVIEGSLETEIEMTLTTTDGTARAPDDYTAVVEVFTLSGEGVRCVNITVRDDDRLERDEVFYANLSTDAHNIFLHRAVAQIVILDDDDATIRFTSEEYVVFESDGTVMLTVVISSGELGRDIHIRVQTISVTAQDPQDYTGLDRTVIFNETVRSISIAVTVQDDNIVEEDERFFAFLHCERNIAVALDPVQTSITIIDDDSVTIGLESTELIISEDDGNITICTTIEDGVLGRQVEVSYSTEDGSAAAPGDYLHASGTLVWNEELYRHCVDIQIEDDLTAEHLEQFSLVLSTSDADVVLEPAIGAIFIQDNDVTDCPLDSSGGILWPRTGPGATRRRECSQVGVGIFQAGPVLRRQCSDLGSWTAADFTVCTVNTRTSDPVLLLWTVVEEITPERRATMFEEEQAVAELFEMFNITYASLVVTVEPFPPLREIVSITAILSPATVISSSLDEFLSFVVHDLDHLGRYTVSGDERGSLRIIPSDTCQCASSKEEPFPLLYLCRGTRTGPCDCVGENSCSCKSPYVGDGTNCTLDRDGDGFPDTPLATCSNSSVEDYCIQDVCPDVSNADQDPVACQNETTEETFDGCPYGRDSIWDVTWANTKRGETSTQPCPGGPNARGMATRVCGEDGKWAGPPNVLECQSVQFIELEEQIDDLVTATRPEPLIQAITSELSSATTPTDGVPLLPLDLNTTNLLTTTLLDVSEARNLSVDESLLQVFDNVLNDMNSNGWSGLQTMGAGSQVVLENVERYGLLLARSDGDTERVLSRPNIVMQTMQFVRGRNTSLEFPQTEDLVNYTTSGSEVPPARVEIPPDFLEQIFMDKGGSVPIVNVLFRNLERFLPTSSEQTQGVSSVISVQVGSRSGVSTSVTDDPISFFFTFDGGEANLNYRCVFWNFSQPVGSGHWASVGLQTVGTTADGNVTTIQCDTTHLTSFAVLVGSDTETSAAEAEALRTVSYLGCAISVACLTLTVLFFIMQRPSDGQQLHALLEQLKAELARQAEKSECILQQNELEYKTKLQELHEKHLLSVTTHKARREDALKNALEPLQQKVWELQHGLAERESELVTLTKQVEVLQAQVQKLAVEKQACASIVKRQQQEALVKQEELQKSREDVDQERNDKQQAEVQHQQALRECDKLQEQLRSLQVQTQEQVQVLRAEEEELQAQVRREKQEHDATLNELQQKDEALEGLQKMLEQEQQQRATAEEKAELVETAMQAKDATATQLQLQLQNVQKQLEDKTQEVHELLQEHEAKLKEKEEECQVTLEQIHAIEAALLRQEESRQYWDQQQAQLTQQINDLEQMVVEKDMVISQLRSDLLHLPLNECDEEEDWEEEGGEDGEYVSASSSMQDVKEPQIGLTGLQQRLEDAERKFAVQQQDLQAQATELQAKSDQLEQREQEAIELHEQLDGMTAKLEERELRITNLEDTVRKKESSVYDHMQKVESALSDSEHSRQNLSQQLQGAQTCIMALKHDNRKLQDGKRTLLAQSTHVARLASQLGATRRESDQLQREKQELRHDLDAMRHQLQTTQDSAAQLQQRFNGANAWIKQLQSKPSAQDDSWKVSPHEVQVLEGDQHVRGRGAWGYVAEGVFRGKLVAVKCAHQLLESPKTIERIHREINTMSKLRHPNLVLFIAAVFEPDRPPMIVTELLDINLRQAYEQDLLNNTSLTTIFRDVACALNYLHSHCEPIIHRDVSAPNILLQGASKGWVAKLSDFGSANAEKLSKTFGEGAFVYSAPEMFPQAPGVEPLPQTDKVDVYGYGVLLCEAILKLVPEDPQDVCRMTERVKSHWPYMHTLITSCIAWKYTDRPTMAAIIKYLNKIVPI